MEIHVAAASRCEVLEIFFTAFFVGEILIKMRVFGLREFLMGGDWYWSWFDTWKAWSMANPKQTADHWISVLVLGSQLAKDILCVVLAFVDLAVTYTTPASQLPGLGRYGGRVLACRGACFDLLLLGKSCESQQKSKDVSSVSQGLGLRIAGHTEDAVTWLRGKLDKSREQF